MKGDIQLTDSAREARTAFLCFCYAGISYYSMIGNSMKDNRKEPCFRLLLISFINMDVETVYLLRTRFMCQNMTSKFFMQSQSSTLAVDKLFKSAS
jgi:hypothetical protein